MLVPSDLGRLGTLTFVVTVETPQPIQTSDTHLRSYHGNLKDVCILYFHSGARI